MSTFGIATEAARAVITAGFCRRLDSQIVAKAHPADTGSLRAMAKLGLVEAGDGSYIPDRSDWSCDEGERA